MTFVDQNDLQNRSIRIGFRPKSLDFLQSQLDFSKITRFGCGSPTESTAFFVWPLETDQQKRDKQYFKYITMVTREKTLFKR